MRTSRFARRALISTLLAGAALAATAPAPEPSTLEIAGRVLDAEGRGASGVVVTAAAPERTVRHATATDAAGRFRIELAQAVPHEVALADPRYAPASARATPGSDDAILRATRVSGSERLGRSAEWLALLPEGERKRWFLLDCTGCHQLNETRAAKDGSPRGAAQWDADSQRMHAQFGPDSPFPILSGHLATAPLGEWLAAALAKPRAELVLPAIDSDYTLTEYDLPGPDLPHDVAVDHRGRVLVTGMFTSRILVLDPATGAIETVEIPIAQANPRAIELDRAGDWWVLLGAPQRIARYQPATRSWTSIEVGMYGHSLALDAGGGVWTNDHFARGGLRLARVVPESPWRVVERRGPPVATSAKGPSPIPYELRVAPDGRVWASLLHGGALAAYDPARDAFETIPLPDPDAGPRRFDVDAAGNLWIPGYASSALYRYEPATKRFARHALPIADALPYVARIDRASGDVWIGTGAADALFRFEPSTARFSSYPVPTRGATMRHLAIDSGNGDVWIAYGASPAIHPTRVARLRRNGR